MSKPGDVVVPDGRIDALWVRGRSPWIAGPDTGPGPVVHGAGPNDWLVGVQFGHGAAGLALGFDASELVNCRVPLDDLLPPRAVATLTEQLEHRSDPCEQARGLASFLADVGRSAPAPDPVVIAVLSGLHNPASASPSTVGERQQRRRFVRAIGYGPQLAARVIRFNAFTERVRTSTAPLAQLATACGYANESHLCRETKALASTTPARLRAGVVRFVQSSRQHVP